MGVQSDPFTGVTVVDNQASLANGDVIDFSTLELDVYRIDLAPGQQVTVSTATPFDNPQNKPLNDLDVDLKLLDVNEDVVASDVDSAGDDLGQCVAHLCLACGQHLLRRGRSAGGAGNYVLRVTSATALDGDFDDDGDYDCDDINALTNAVAAGGFDANFDLSGDGLALNLDDVDAWLAEAARTTVSHPLTCTATPIWMAPSMSATSTSGTARNLRSMPIGVKEILTPTA